METIAPTGIDIVRIREEFPVLEQEVNGKPLVYFDNAATTQKPMSVINALVNYYVNDNANIHRGAHTLAHRATLAFEATRKAIKNFINAPEEEQIIFTKGTTDAINLVATAWGRKFVGKGDEIIISGMEHHSNIVPWQMLCEAVGAELKIIPIDENGALVPGSFEKMLSSKTKLVSVMHVSNVLGTVNPVKEIIKAAHTVGARVLIDGAQAVAHEPVDVEALDCDFYAFSGHKMYGPTGTGVLYGKRDALEEANPYQGGGEMIKEVSFEKTTYNEIPYKFEAGTPNIADIIALNEAVQFIGSIGKENIAAYELLLLNYAQKRFSEIPGLRFIGTTENKTSVISFVSDKLHHFDIGMLLDARGIAVRTGHHCAQPLMKRFGTEGTVRASFAVYNTEEEIDSMAEALKKFIK